MLACAVLASSFFCASSSFADTKYKYYSVSGRTALEILNSIDRRGPSVAGVGAYATTYASYKQTGQMQKMSAKLCKVGDYDLDFQFVINLPRLKNEAALPKPERKAWRTFSAFVKSHEDQHKQIWLNCKREHMVKVRRITASTCGQVEAKVSKLLEETRKVCNQRHANLDAASRKPLGRQPLIKMAYGN
jgi:predicted secreted Zn-dependent protease